MYFTGGADPPSSAAVIAEGPIAAPYDIPAAKAGPVGVAAG